MKIVVCAQFVVRYIDDKIQTNNMNEKELFVTLLFEILLKVFSGIAYIRNH